MGQQVWNCASDIKAPILLCSTTFSLRIWQAKTLKSQIELLFLKRSTIQNGDWLSNARFPSRLRKNPSAEQQKLNFSKIIRFASRKTSLANIAPLVAVVALLPIKRKLSCGEGYSSPSLRRRARQCSPMRPQCMHALPVAWTDLRGQPLRSGHFVQMIEHWCHKLAQRAELKALTKQFPMRTAKLPMITAHELENMISNSVQKHSNPGTACT